MSIHNIPLLARAVALSGRHWDYVNVRKTMRCYKWFGGEKLYKVLKSLEGANVKVCYNEHPSFYPSSPMSNVTIRILNKKGD
jgi:hypothetical protein